MTRAIGGWWTRAWSSAALILCFSLPVYGQSLSQTELEKALETTRAFQQPAPIYPKDFQQPPIGQSGCQTGNCGDDYGTEPVFYFISFSVPAESLAANIAEAIRLNKQGRHVTAVLRGFRHNSLKETIRSLYDVLQARKDLEGEEMPLTVDPVLFDKYGIEKVPVVVSVAEKGVGTVRGDVSLAYAMEKAASLKDEGKVGNTYEIEEEDFLAVIASRQNEIQENLKRRLPEIAKRTHTLTRFDGAFSKAKEDRTYYVDLNYTFKEDIVNPQTGEVVVAAGHTVNPPDFYGGIKDRNIVIDGNDPAQVRYALSEGIDVIMLISGDAMEVMKKTGRRVYLANEAIISKLKIERVPAIFETEGKNVKVFEKAID